MEKKFIDYYKLLKLSKDATPEEIREVYHKAMKECHPDVYANADEKTQQQAERVARFLNEIRDVLLNPEKRKAYDASLEEYYANLNQQEETKESEPSSFEFNDEPYEDNHPEPLTIEEAFEMIKEAYQKARAEEKEYPLVERHRDIETDYKETVGAEINNAALRTAAGLGAHITQELVYQLSKLRHRKGENFLEYTMRNRRNIATFLVAFSIFSSSIINKEDKTFNNDNEAIETVESLADEPQTELTRYYTIKDGDNLSSLAYDSGTSIEEIQKLNGLNSQIIYAGDTIKIPYKVNESDLYYYAEVVDVEGRSLDELASLYETDTATLKKLNTTAIGTETGTDEILTNQIFVPKFVNRDMLQVLKTENTNNNKLV
ncbi:MAG: DnaJ domain-containing protein [Bacilli bacterium]|nr:DnaJ domain-containing protein [Bacilli bacterium]